MTTTDSDPLALHRGFGVQVLQRLERPMFEIVRTELRRSRDDTVSVVHIAPRAGEVLDADLDELVQLMGFTPNSGCPTLKGRTCHVMAIPPGVQTSVLVNTLERMQRLYGQARLELTNCGFDLDAKPGPSTQGSAPAPEVAKSHRRFTDGHSGTMRSRRAELEHDGYNMVLVWLEEPDVKGWVVHYQRHESPGPREEAALRFVGLRTFDACPEFAFTPCYWHAAVVPSSGTFHDERSEVVRAQFQAHYRYFAPALEKVLAVEAEAASLALAVLPASAGPAAEAQTVASSAGSAFTFIRDAALRVIAERDHRDLIDLLPQPQQLKAKITLSGSVVEAVLFDQLRAAGLSAQELSTLSLGQLVRRARGVSLGIGDGAVGLADAVRDFRNFSHPAVEMRERALAQEDVDAALALMNLILRAARAP